MYMSESMFLSLIDLYIVLMTTSTDLAQKIFATDMLRTLKSHLEHRHKHILRSLRLYGHQALLKADFLSSQKLLAAIRFQRKSMMQVLRAIF